MKHTVYILHTNIEDSEWYSLHPTEESLKKALVGTIIEHIKRNRYRDPELSALLRAGEVYEAWDLWKNKHLGDLDFTYYEDQPLEIPDPAPPAHPPQIVITLEGGVLQDIANIPKETEVVVLDYDTDGADEDRLKVNPWSDKGDKCILSHYIGEGTNLLPYKEIK